MKLIDGDALSETLRESLKIFEAHGVSVLGVPKALLAIVENAPTVDAEPVRRGRWVDDNCSICGVYVHHGDCRIYFPNCGAKMDGGENDGKAD